jgi:serine/threonine-protein kinase RIM15
MVDWWALGVVLYEFLYGFPPFHAETPEKVFDNVVSRRIDWHEDEIELSAEARDLMDRLMCYDANQRLGSRGAGEVRQHAFFAGIDWSTVATAEASFVPEVTDPESTDYFDARGAMNAFQDDDTVPQVLKQKKSAAGEMSAVIDDIAAQDDFGAFEFRNLPVLKQANDDVIRKLRTESMTTMSQALEQGVNMRDRGRSASASAKARKPSGRKLSDLTMPSSPATSASSLASTPSRPTTPSTASASAAATQQHHGRRPSELKAFDRLKSDDADLARRNSAPSRVRNGSEGRALSGSGPSPSMELWRQRRQASMNTEIVTTSTREEGTSTDSAIASQSDSESAPPRRGSDRALDVLIAEDNPISQKVSRSLACRTSTVLTGIDPRDSPDPNGLQVHLRRRWPAGLGVHYGQYP